MFLLIFSSCKNEVKHPKDELVNETEMSKPEDEGKDDVEVEESEIDLVEIMGTMGDLLTGNN
ncbi:MAG: hypothetical protein KJN76_10735, partial [Eudoraea sp.]|nr:hypothetical protein [Eudoraea sp.]